MTTKDKKQEAARSDSGVFKERMDDATIMAMFNEHNSMETALTLAEIAEKLGYSKRTAATRMDRLYGKDKIMMRKIGNHPNATALYWKE